MSDYTPPDPAGYLSVDIVYPPELEKTNQDLVTPSKNDKASNVIGADKNNTKKIEQNVQAEVSSQKNRQEIMPTHRHFKQDLSVNSSLNKTAKKGNEI